MTSSLLLTIYAERWHDDKGEGGGGLDTPQKWWRHLWTAPYSDVYIISESHFIKWILTFHHLLLLPFIRNDKTGKRHNNHPCPHSEFRVYFYLIWNARPVHFIFFTECNNLNFFWHNNFKESHLCWCRWGCPISFVHLLADITDGSLSYWRHPIHSQKSSSTCSSDPRGSRSLFQNSARWFSPVSPEEKIFAFLNCLRHERVTCGYWHPMNSMLPKVWARPTWNIDQYFLKRGSTFYFPVLPREICPCGAPWTSSSVPNGGWSKHSVNT